MSVVEIEAGGEGSAICGYGLALFDVKLLLMLTMLCKDYFSVKEF